MLATPCSRGCWVGFARRSARPLQQRARRSSGPRPDPGPRGGRHWACVRQGAALFVEVVASDEAAGRISRSSASTPAAAGWPPARPLWISGSARTAAPWLSRSPAALDRHRDRGQRRPEPALWLSPLPLPPSMPPTCEYENATARVAGCRDDEGHGRSASRSIPPSPATRSPCGGNASFGGCAHDL